MAYMNQQKKATIVANVKPVLKKYGLKGTFSVRNHMTICLTITSGPIDFIQNYKDHTGKQNQMIEALDINPYWFQDHFTGKAKQALTEIIKGMYSAGYYDNSDIQSDYFDTAYYIDVNIGKWDKPYQVL
jgi:hypothetical protein